MKCVEQERVRNVYHGNDTAGIKVLRFICERKRF